MRYLGIVMATLLLVSCGGDDGPTAPTPTPTPTPSTPAPTPPNPTPPNNPPSEPWRGTWEGTYTDRPGTLRVVLGDVICTQCSDAGGTVVRGTLTTSNPSTAPLQTIPIQVNWLGATQGSFTMHDVYFQFDAYDDCVFMIFGNWTLTEMTGKLGSISGCSALRQGNDFRLTKR